MTVLAVWTVLAVLESTLILHNEAAVAVLTVMAVSFMTATPLKLNPPFP